MGPALLAIGLSMLLRTESWAKSLKAWRKDRLGMVGMTLMELVLALVILVKHNIWEAEPWVLITLIGWAMLLESLIILLSPEKTAQAYLRLIGQEKSVRIFGLTQSVLGLCLAHLAYSG